LVEQEMLMRHIRGAFEGEARIGDLTRNAASGSRLGHTGRRLPDPSPYPKGAMDRRIEREGRRISLQERHGEQR
jgi:hypothetical protein